MVSWGNKVSRYIYIAKVLCLFPKVTTYIAKVWRVFARETGLFECFAFVRESYAFISESFAFIHSRKNICLHTKISSMGFLDFISEEQNIQTEIITS